ncbi:TOMM precursor leader peptide-binding protein [Kitasatospora sp. NBC_01287]|uniref:TOMM precursor leader peptide-binding protein n=1 Tax=Kitasatospora sp. NBC_01287 TaxID=2903573 RepID=UPI00224D83C6|nr:TOMM precursor leader peptide-binding protein [Kitasatospora sp. NBC_01287]MCX4745734.1 TOMM precursor leader peptide-binding protein [Kitasatospora sp. NBC_01287]
MALYEEIAQTRPRIRRDVLYTRTPTGVLFHNAHGGFSLTTKNAYRFAALIVPHLDGTNRLADICAGLGENQRSMVTELVGALYGRGFARDAGPAPQNPAPLSPEVAARFAAQVDYVDHYVDDAAARFARYRGTRVAVLGEDELARWCALSLVRNGCAELSLRRDFPEVTAEAAELGNDGCPVTIHQLPPVAGWAQLADADVVVVTSGAAQVLELLAAELPEGRRLLPAWTIGDRAVLGPLLTAGRAGCWVCAALRLGANGEPGEAAELWSRVAPLAPLEYTGRQPGRPLAAMLGNLLGYEVFRLATGALPAETDGKLIVQDLDSLDVVCEPLLPHPRCPRCAALAEDPEPVAPTTAELDAASAPRPQPADGAAEEAAAQAALAELEARAVLVQPRAGLFSEYADDAWHQTPLKAGTVTLNLRPGLRRRITAFDVHHVAGARLRALRRAAELYAEQVIPPAGLVVEPAGLAATGEAATGQAATGGATTGPAALRGATTVDPATADLVAVDPAALSTASGLPIGRVTAWGPARSLLTGRTHLVPAAALRPFGPHNQDRGFEATGAGGGAGGTLAEASARALCSALGYDALRRALRGAAEPAVVPLDLLLSDVELTFLVRAAKNLGVDLELLRLGGPEEPLPVVLARDGGTRWALGSGPSLRDAVLAAARDLLGLVQLGRDLGPGQQGDAGDTLLAGLDPAVLVPGGGTADEPADELTARRSWSEVLARLRAAGRDVLLAPAGAADLRSGRLQVVKALLLDGITGEH